MPNPFMPRLTTMLMWVTRGENCPICDSLRGRVYGYDTWMSAGVWPGFHLNCDCYLKDVSEQEYDVSDLDFFGTDLNLLSDTINPNVGFLKFHLDPSYKPYSWYMTEQITEAHLTYGAELSIGEVLKKMRDDFVGFFKRSTFYDNFFIWRTFKTLQHYQSIDNDLTGTAWWRENFFKRLGFRDFNYYFPIRKGSESYIYPYMDAVLKPDSIKPWNPYQTYTYSSSNYPW